MKGLETVLFAFALILVPASGWLVGRAAGRRDWPIGPVVAAGLATTLGLQALRVGLLLLAEVIIDLAPRRGLSEMAMARLFEAVTQPGLLFFLTVFGMFMMLLGWASVPVQPQEESLAPPTHRSDGK